MRPRGGVVTQRSAKPCTPVQFWSWPPSTSSSCCGEFFSKSFSYAAAPRLDGAAAREGLPQADRWAARNVHVKSRLGRRDRSRFLRRRCFLQNLTVAITRLRRSFYCADASWLAKALTSELAAARSAGGVPALGKRQQRPGQPIVVGGFRRLIEYRLVAQEVLLGRGRNGRSYGIQQQIEFSFAHRALLRFERVGSQNSFVSGLSE
jgi:hypothetical protein